MANISLAHPAILPGVLIGGFRHAFMLGICLWLAASLSSALARKSS